MDEHNTTRSDEDTKDEGRAGGGDEIDLLPS